MSIKQPHSGRLLVLRTRPQATESGVRWTGQLPAFEFNGEAQGSPAQQNVACRIIISALRGGGVTYVCLDCAERRCVRAYEVRSTSIRTGCEVRSTACRRYAVGPRVASQVRPRVSLTRPRCGVGLTHADRPIDMRDQTRMGRDVPLLLCTSRFLTLVSRSRAWPLFTADACAFEMIRVLCTVWTLCCPPDSDALHCSRVVPSVGRHDRNRRRLARKATGSTYSGQYHLCYSAQYHLCLGN